MKICKVCLESNMLCAACNSRVEKGEIKQVEVALSRALHEMNKEKGLGLDFLMALENNGKVFVVVESRHAAGFIGPGGKNIKKLSGRLGRQLKMLEKAEGSDKHVMEKLIGAPVLGINRIYSGVESYKVRVERRYMRMVEPLVDVVGKVMGRKVSFVFE